MAFAPFLSGLLTGLREGVEAALIVAIICAYLVKTGNRRHFPKIFAGAGAAIVLSAVLGFGLYATVGAFEEPYEQLFEAATMIFAAAVVTWMLFWMRRQSASVRGELQTAVDRALDDGSAIALALLAFVAVIREGLETALFLVGQAAAADVDAPWVLAGALAGLGLAILIGVGFYQGSRRIDLATFFRWTGVALVFIAAGLLSRAVHELVEIGVISIGSQPLFDLASVLPHEGNLVGEILRALFGYTSSPEVITFVVWITYVVVVLALYLRPVRRPPASAPPPRPPDVQSSSDPHIRAAGLCEPVVDGSTVGRPARIEPGPGQESVWDYPRPPRVEPVPERLRVIVDGEVIADTTRGLRVLETAGAPGLLHPAGRRRLAAARRERAADGLRVEGRGATYHDYVGPSGRRIEGVAWSYADPNAGYEAIRGHLAFYAGRVDEAWVGDERATPQPGGFYGGWVTSRIVGPIKGEPGSFGW